VNLALGEAVPWGWLALKVKRVAHLRAGDAITADAIEPFGSYPVYGGNGLRGFTKAFTHDGEYVLVGRQGALCGNVVQVCGQFWASEHAIVCTPKLGQHVQWLGWALEAMNLNQYSQSAAQPGLAVDTIRDLLLPVPPGSEQQAIAEYLDRETARIDALVAKQRRLIELAQEERAAAVSERVLCGPPIPGAGAGALQGRFPGHWRVVPFRWLLNEIDDRSETGDELLLSVSQTRGVIPQSELGDRHQFAESYIGYKRCHAGDLVVNRMWVYYGALGVAPCDGLVSPDYAVFRASDPEVNVPLVAELLRTHAFIGEMTRRVRGIGVAFQGTVRKPRLHPRDLGLIAIPVPPLDEARRILEDIAALDIHFHRICTTAADMITLLTERRQALITAAVTGQFDVARVPA
jgi:type I restriction enzyme, S subunit